MRFVVCYDIAEDRRRVKVSEALLNFGQRIQESVFLADLETERYEVMLERLKALLNPVEDCAHVFVLCEACGRRVVALGRGEVIEKKDFYIV